MLSRKASHPPTLDGRAQQRFVGSQSRNGDEMGNVFLSCAREDSVKAAIIAKALPRAGRMLP
jgi:hypothetical protein